MVDLNSSIMEKWNMNTTNANKDHYIIIVREGVSKIHCISVYRSFDNGDGWMDLCKFIGYKTIIIFHWIIRIIIPK